MRAPVRSVIEALQAAAAGGVREEKEVVAQLLACNVNENVWQPEEEEAEEG